MAEGAVRHSAAQVALSITGVAGPTGGSADKPVGTVCFAWATPSGVSIERLHLSGDRAAVRYAAAEHALIGLLQRL
jgi:nicotinamide-nucleotide amidase